MNSEKKKEWLLRYRQALKEVKAARLELQVLWSEAEKITPALSGLPGGNGRNEKIPKAVERIAQAKEELQQKESACAAIYTETKRAIDALNDTDGRTILSYHYIVGLKWEQVADEVGFTLRHTQRRAKEAIELLKI